MPGGPTYVNFLIDHFTDGPSEAKRSRNLNVQPIRLKAGDQIKLVSEMFPFYYPGTQMKKGLE